MENNPTLLVQILTEVTELNHAICESLYNKHAWDLWILEKERNRKRKSPFNWR